MFKVLTGEKKRRVFSPATIIASVAAHLLLLGGLVYASTGDTEFVDDVICLVDCELPPLTPEPPAPPPPPIIEQPTPPTVTQTDEPVRPPVPGEELAVREVTVPDSIPTEVPGAVPVDPRMHDGQGPIGDVPGPPPAEPTQPSGDPTPAPTGPIHAHEAEVLPVLDRNGLSRVLERHYPAVLRDARVSGRVVIELVVDEEGVPVEGSARVIEASHPAFGEAALRAVDRFRFRPARIGRTPIPVVVTIPIQWTVPD